MVEPMLDPVAGNSGYGAVIGYVAKTTGYVILATDRGRIINVDTSGGSVTITQLAAATAGAGFSYIVRKSTSDANTVVLGTVDGGAKTLSKVNEGRLIVSTGAAYISQTWQDPAAVAITAGTIAGVTFTTLDSLFTLQDNVDATKQAQFQLSGISAGQTRTFTLPNATCTLAAIDSAATWTALQTFGVAIASSVTTGTAPFTIASTTVCANLNSALLNGATFAAPGTIGSGTPGAASFAGITMSDATDIAVNTSTGTKIGTATGQKIGFWNAAPVIQQAGAAQAAPAAYVTGAFGLDSNAHMQALFDLVVAMRTALVNSGIIKGSA